MHRAVLCGLVQVKIGGGSDLDTEQVCELLTSATDSVMVHSVGFTLTLYRYVEVNRRISTCSRPSSLDIMVPRIQSL
jgi:RNA-binding protein YhbY